jgi:hypothetical protein
MEIPVWILCLIVVAIVAFTFVWLQQGSKTIKLWEREANEILIGCGYGDIPSPSVVESKNTYIAGRHNKRGNTTSSKIFLCTKRSNGENFSNNTVMMALIHELAHIVSPEADHEDKEFIEAMDKLSLCASGRRSFDPFKKKDPGYPCRME